jgi:GT2 family glycosyltransferase
MSTALSCSVVIIAYNSRDYISACIASVTDALQGIESEIIVVDNGSPIPILEEQKKAFPNVRWIDSPRNLGFGKGCNLAAKMATKEILFFINPDTVVSKGTFQSTLAYIESKPDAGAVGCKILNGDGSLQWACRRSFPSPFAAICKTIGLSALFPKSKIFASYNMT